MARPERTGNGESPVNAALRRDRMLAVIRESDFVRVGELSERFGISEVTVRSDLDALAGRGEVHRIRGGAIPRTLPDKERPFEESETSFAEEKVAIGRAAAELVRDGETLLMDVGTTTAAAARRVVLADGSKIGRVELAHLCHVEDVNLVITGESADPGVVDALRERGTEVRLVA